MSSHLEKSLLFSLLPRFDKVCVPFAAVLYWYRCPYLLWQQGGGVQNGLSVQQFPRDCRSECSFVLHLQVA